MKDLKTYHIIEKVAYLPDKVYTIVAYGDENAVIEAKAAIVKYDLKLNHCSLHEYRTSLEKDPFGFYDFLETYEPVDLLLSVKLSNGGV